MRESLTIFAIGLILVLSALLVGPYLVDWNHQRDWLSAKLSKTIGATVRIAGPIDVKLLPRPIFRVSQVSIEGRTPQDPRFSATTLDAELSINSLLQGSVEFVDADVTGPRIELTTRADGSLVAPTWDVTNPQRFMFRHVRLRDGTLAVKDESGRERLALTGLAGQGEAETLFGPLKLTGEAAGSKGVIKFRLNTGAYSGRRMRARLVADTVGPIAHVDLDGILSAGTAGTKPGVHAPIAFDGTMIAAGALHIADGAAPVPWQVTASDAKADDRQISTTSVELRAGLDGRALVATGAGLLALGESPSLDLKLRARQLDLDNIAVPPDVAPDTPRPKPAQWMRVAQELIGPDGVGTTLPLRLSLDYAIDAVTTGDLTLTDAKGSIDAIKNVPIHGRFALDGPNASHLSLDGTVEPGAGAVFKGHVEAATRDLDDAALWLAPLAPNAPDWIAHNLPVHAIAFKGALDLSKTGFVARDATLALDGSTVSGTIALTDGLKGAQPRLFADVVADTLDTEHLPAWSDVGSALSPLDLSLRVAAGSVKLSRSGLGDVATGKMSLRLTKANAVVTLDEFSVADLGGATIKANGSLDAERKLAGKAHIEAHDLGSLAAMARQLAPDVATDGVVARAGLLSPANLDVVTRATIGADGALLPTYAAATGLVGATRLSATVTPEPGARFDPATLNALVVLDAPDAGPLFRQGGWDTAPTGLFGHGHIEVTARGTRATGFDTHATAAIADTAIRFDGQIGSETSQGRLSLRGPDLAPLLRSLALAGGSTATPSPWQADAALQWKDGGLAFDGLTARVGPSTVTGSLAYALATPALKGALSIDVLPLSGITALALGMPAVTPPKADHQWTDARFPPGPSALPPLQVALQVGSLGLTPSLSAQKASFDLKLSPGVLALTNLAGSLLGGQAGGAMTIRRDGGAASLTGQFKFDNLSLTPPSLRGRLAGTLNVAGSGTSPDGVIASLAGDGNLALTEASMPRLAPQALSETAKAFDKEGVAVDDDTVRESLLKSLDRGALDLGSLSAPATLAAGTLRVVDVRGGGSAVTSTTEAALNIRTLDLTLRTAVTATELPKDWKGDPPQVTVTWRGPLGAPTRDIDSAAFTNGLAARAIARDQERIQLMQDDLRERAFFARRLKAIEAEQQAEREAAQAARALLTGPKPADPRAQKPEDGKTVPAPLPPSRPANRAAAGTAKPVELQPSPQTVGQDAPPPNVADPSSAGRY